MVDGKRIRWGGQRREHHRAVCLRSYAKQSTQHKVDVGGVKIVNSNVGERLRSILRCAAARCVFVSIHTIAESISVAIDPIPLVRMKELIDVVCFVW